MSTPTVRTAKLALADGTVYTGRAFGAPGETCGEVVFNTSMMGYQEVLTDPSYTGQIVTMTYPLIGNYGTTAADQESGGVRVAGFVVRELTRVPSNFRSDCDLNAYLKKSGVTGIEGIDTRSLVRRLRVRGAMNGVLSTADLDDASLVAKARKFPGMEGRDLVSEVVPKKAFEWSEGFGQFAEHVIPAQKPEKHVVAVDYGMKWNILRCLTQVGCKVTVVPGTATADQILAHKPDGVFLSNGPGDPAAVGYAIDTVKGLIGKKPLFGICLGHQLLGLAVGAKTFKLKFGHRGSNQPVLDERTGRVEITTQNHGFSVDPATLPSDMEPTHVNLNDRTLEGMRHKTLPAFSVQYHPEAAAGPHDSTYLFEEFRKMMG
ncbi:carbamoyl phosphate synthase small subunit : Carbamoyl-phosphate synthase small chain OS=Planctomyces limnophilus (strain ATCC 43296 / DSM 3776 / IFAM 1008 / 290) GN=carA PE=3 SV=1: CPSase_sm_chain: GATase [Gemmataceae bacterium]|nr:carbamoyl phosphate synthase small subunit : Carbamoyl-phosphate synthase small chain OS=Planctomyces limnophilus (strain ATCC 43296 / DSM 3776 / IFAM 1008 / 290) GN=carA PE=3 SV=1: CPSase_sm_chain: GATase [Gemmataceae bacterium]VTU00633.1 carbamoyl phosphate synthase small subunit : Carbamoyl-phosphate synthase small chain OS=Planctomyces limnophilus (strain ATCC 43296 / DSM 3776 / IFAM 1008 / 290) GN=carA PE=3 SV=1: CPSase_sm_chain: GATase [Gemmataceae bacterium]